MTGARDRLKLGAPLRAQVLIVGTDAIEELGRRDVVILDDGATLGVLQNVDSSIPTDRMMINEDIVRVLQERIDRQEVLNLTFTKTPILGKQLNLMPAPL